MIFLVCGSLSLPKKDEDIIHQTIYRTVKGKDVKGFIAWLKNGRLTVESDVLAQLLNPAFTMSCAVTPSSTRWATQGQRSVLFHSSDRRRHVEHPTERKSGCGWNAATPTFNTKPNRVMGKLMLKSKLRYGELSFDSADLKFFSQEFQEIPQDIIKHLLQTNKHVQETSVKIMWVPSHNQQLIYVGDQEIEMADNDLLLLKTRVKNGVVSFHEDDIEARYPADWQVPVYILEDLKRKASNGKLFIISDEKGNLRCTVKRTERV